MTCSGYREGFNDMQAILVYKGFHEMQVYV